MNEYKNFYKRVNFDIDSKILEKFIVKNTDTGTRGFYVKIIQNNKVVIPNSSDSLTFYGEKPDGTLIFETGVLDNGVFRIDLPNQAFTAIGDMLSEFTLRGPNSETISTKDFVITVEKSRSLDSAIESTDSFGALQSALSQINNFAGDIQAVQLFADNIASNIGLLSELDTFHRDTIVNAINELNEDIDDLVNSSQLDNLLNLKVDKTVLGDMSTLNTNEKDILVNAINEIKLEVDNIRISSDIDELLPLILSKADKTTTGKLSDLTEPATSLVDAINLVNQLLIDTFEGIDLSQIENKVDKVVVGELVNLNTTNKVNIVNAINEINTALRNIEEVTNVGELITLMGSKANKVDLGDLSTLITIDKTNVVKAVNELKNNITNIELTPGPQGQPGQPGKDGYTPVKGIDYFDGQDGEDGQPGPQGPPGISGGDANVTYSNVVAALGFTPADETVIGDINDILDYINGEVI